MSVQLELETTTARVHRYDEYGNPLDATAAAAEYGSLGAYQRATNGLAGYTLMGVRVYDPTTGRFLQADPVYGGNADAYVYPADPITQLDTSGSRLNLDPPAWRLWMTLAETRKCLVTCDDGVSLGPHQARSTRHFRDAIFPCRRDGLRTVR
ncbi:hypothetical protein OG508_34300 [Streptomyces sp. NBC_01108]|nr:hypothetical protein OG508_34300 [Streptomyces sp. NBC_01108]